MVDSHPREDLTDFVVIVSLPLRCVRDDLVRASTSFIKGIVLRVTVSNDGVEGWLVAFGRAISVLRELYENL